MRMIDRGRSGSGLAGAGIGLMNAIGRSGAGCSAGLFKVQPTWQLAWICSSTESVSHCVAQLALSNLKSQPEMKQKRMGDVERRRHSCTNLFCKHSDDQRWLRSSNGSLHSNRSLLGTASRANLMLAMRPAKWRKQEVSPWCA